MPSGSEPKNIILLGATGRVGCLIRAALAQKPADGVQIRPQTRDPILAQNAGWFHFDPLAAKVPAAGPFPALPKGSFAALIDLTGVTGGGKAALEVNPRLALAGLALARHLAIPQVFLASSAAVYGAAGVAHVLAETDPVAPASDYGRSKLAMEQAAFDWQAGQGPSAPRLTCLRIGNVAGADQLLLNAGRAEQTAPLMLDRFADGSTPRRSYIGSETLAAVLVSLIRAAADGKVLPDILNIAAPGAVSMADLLDAYAAAGHPVARQDRAAPKTAIPLVALDTTRLEAFHRFTTADSEPREMIRQMIACQQSAP